MGKSGMTNGSKLL